MRSTSSIDETATVLRITMPTFTRLLAMRIVASRRRGLLNRSSTLRPQCPPRSFRSRSCVGVSEKSATSLALKAALHTSSSAMHTRMIAVGASSVRQYSAISGGTEGGSKQGVFGSGREG